MPTGELGKFMISEKYGTTSGRPASSEAIVGPLRAYRRKRPKPGSVEDKLGREPKWVYCPLCAERLAAETTEVPEQSEAYRRRCISCDRTVLVPGEKDGE